MNLPPVALVMPTLPSILAHQGGWDEILLVVGPLALIAAGLWMANRRVTAQLDALGGDDAGDGPTGGAATDGAASGDRKRDGEPGPRI